MNPLEKLKDKLKTKPILQEREQVQIVIPVAKKQEKIKVNVEIKDERDNKFDRDELKRKLMESKISKLVIKQPQVPEETIIEKEADVKEPVVKRAKKMATKPLLIIEEESGEGEGEKMIELDKDIEGVGADVGIVVEKKRKVKEPRLPKGVVIIEPHEFIKIGDTSMIKRLPKSEPPINIKVSSYYMNNREFFINFINSLFEPYKKEIESSENIITCDKTGKENEGFGLLTHQKVIRDYMNLYTPYRGLLLFHGLGSGKTCSSIAIAEGMKTKRQIIVLMPASLQKNYMEELKKCGDSIYKKQQYWEWVSLTDYPDAIETLSSVLNLPVEYIKRKNGAWLVNVKKPSNYKSLGPKEKTSLDNQLDEMIQTKYRFVPYNGLRRKRFSEMTDNFETNLFDNSVVIIDEAHNLISRIVNKVNKEKEVKMDKRGEMEKLPKALSLIIYYQLLRAKNCRIILLSGTPIINYPNEIGVLYNILRGYIKTWEIPLDVKTKNKIDTDALREMFSKEKVIDYIEYSPSSKKLYITRNPFGFKNKIKESSGYKGVSNEKKNEKGEVIIDEDFVSDEAFESRVIGTLKNNNIDVEATGIKIHNYTALPTDKDAFFERFVDTTSGEIKNIDVFKRRILGLTSYFRSAQEDLLPRYEKTPQYYHVEKIPMSDYQFQIYENARVSERELEKDNKSKKPKSGGELYNDSASTYRIFSRLYCNYVMKSRPVPVNKKDDGKINTSEFEELIKNKNDTDGDLDDKTEGEVGNSAEDLLDLQNMKKEDNAEKNTKMDVYKKNIEKTLVTIASNPDQYLTPEALEYHSPKFLRMLENIKNPENAGLHLVYSQFRTLEGIGIFSMVLDANGFTRFKLKRNFAGDWEIDIPEEELGKPTYALYTGTETVEEKEIIRNIYNGEWEYIPTNLEAQLKEISNNNNMGEIIKVLMITSSGSEGINLLNTRFVHAMEPYWHPVRIEQVIGRARRICSHKKLPKALQTVEVFIYLMTFTEKQIKSDEAIELRKYDVGKKQKVVPLTSDEYLFEISSIKEEINLQIIKAIKETAIDCAIYSKASKEGLKCITFGEPSNKTFAYVPNIEKQENDVITKKNKKTIEWTGEVRKINGVKYVTRKMDDTHYNVYDYESYKKGKDEGTNPILVGTITVLPNGSIEFNTLIT